MDHDHDHDHGQVNDEQLDGEREVRRRMALTQIRQWPDPVLKQRAQEVEDFDEDLGGSSSGWAG